LQGGQLPAQVGNQSALRGGDALDRRQFLVDFLAGKTRNFGFQFFHDARHGGTLGDGCGGKRQNPHGLGSFTATWTISFVY
jgi:hypothetical protein